MISSRDVFIYMFPGIMYFWVYFIGQGPMQEILSERERNTLARMLAAPVSLLEFLLSKILRCVLLCTAIQLLLLAASALLFGLRWGHPLLLLPAVLASSLSVTGLLGLVYALARTRDQAYSISSVVVIVCAFAGGSFFPFRDLPAFLQAVGQFTPNRWSVLAFQTIAFSPPPADVVKPVALLCAIGLAGCVAAVLLFRRQWAGGGRR
jgi:ABC-2 type transport system permease protein